MAKRPSPDAARPPLRSERLSLGEMEDRLGLRLRSAKNQVFREIKEAFAPYDISPLGHMILFLINKSQGCRQADLRDILAVKQPNLVERLDALVAQGLIERSPDPNDRRAAILKLTSSGAALLAKIDEVDETLNQSLIQRLGKKDHAMLIALLKKVELG